MSQVTLLIVLAMTLAVGIPIGLVQLHDARNIGIVVNGADANGVNGGNANGANGGNLPGLNGTSHNGANGGNHNGLSGIILP